VLRLAVVACVSAAALTGTALAADLPAPVPAAPAPAAVVVTAPPALFDWSGLYIGANLGFGSGDFDGLLVPTGTLPTDTPVAVADAWSGVLGGVQVGYNAQMGGIVFGAEADFAFTDIDYDIMGTGRAPGPGPLDNARAVDPATIPAGYFAHAEIDWLATVRARLGYAFDRVLPYVTGGVAFADVDITAGDDDASATDSNLHVGWTVGVGLEYAATHALSVKAEYLFVDLGEETYFDAGNAFAFETELHIGRIGINYRF